MACCKTKIARASVQAQAELVFAVFPVKAFVGDVRHSVYDLAPPIKRSEHHGIVDDGVDDPLHVGRFEDEDHLAAVSSPW